MRSRLVPVVLLFQTAIAVAAPLPSAPSPPRPAQSVQQDEVAPDTIFAQQLIGVSNQVVELYVRPVDRADLLYASLAGLYEAARLPVPERLQANVQAAATAAIVVEMVWQLTFPCDCWQYAVAVEEEALVEVVRRVRQDVNHAEALGSRNPLLICCQAMARALDPYSGVVTAEEQRRSLGLEQEATGVGLEVREHLGTGPLLVKAVHPGSPAQRGGLRPDDRITVLDGRPVREWTDEQVVQRLTQPPSLGDLLDGSSIPTPPVGLSYERPGRRAITVLTLPVEQYRAEYVLGINREDDQSWNYLVDPKGRLAHVRLAALGRGCSRDLAAVVARLHEDGLRGLILDLRWCPGGYLDEAVDVARLFLREGVVATVKVRNQPDQVKECKRGASFADFPVVVLVNGETSGGAEMIAAALQDHHRAVVAGQRTLGKASVQTPVHLGVGQVGMKLTSGTFFRPGDKNLHRFPDSKDEDDWGVQPDDGFDLRVSADLGKQLKQWWLLQTLRPGDSRERLPLDDPCADPQRQGALEALRELIPRGTLRATAE